MLTAIVLIRCERSRVNETAQLLVDMPGIAEVYSVSGKHDLAAIIRVKSPAELSDLVTKHMSAVQGIRKTETMFALRAYSQHDLEGVFTIGE